jgi:RNA polymerase sigma-70 factor (ECF subfamily)
VNEAFSTHEKEMIEGCRKGKSKYQEMLYRHFYGYAMGICLRYANSHDEACEMVNDSFLKIFTKMHQYDEKNPFRAWLRRVVINTAIDYYRKNKKHTGFQDIQQVRTEETDENALDKLSAEDILKLLLHVPEHYRIIFNLYEIEGYSHEEISQQLDIPESTSRTYLSRAKTKLRECIQKFFRTKELVS